MIKTLKKLDWKDIKVGEVFAIKDGKYCDILCKLDDNEFFTLSDNYELNFSYAGDVVPGWFFTEEGVYKLPIIIQRLWRSE